MAKKGKFVKRLVSPTTTNKQKAIINFLISKGHSASRINTAGIWDEKAQAFRKTGGRVGHSDISGSFKCISVINNVVVKFGLAFYIEGKFTESDTLSKEQIEFREEVQETGAFYLECENLEQFYYWYKEVEENINLTLNGKIEHI